MGPAIVLPGSAVVGHTRGRPGHRTGGERLVAHRRHVRGHGRTLLLRYLPEDDAPVHRLPSAEGAVWGGHQLREDRTRSDTHVQRARDTRDFGSRRGNGG